MKKEVIGRFFIGFLIGFFIGKFVNLLISIFVGGGVFIDVMPQLASHFKTEVAAVVAQDVLISVIGIIFAEAGLIFNIDKWSPLKQYIVHFFITAVFYIPFTFLCWMPNNIKGLFIIAGNVLFTYALTWFIQYKHSEKTIKEINQKIKEGATDA